MLYVFTCTVILGIILAGIILKKHVQKKLMKAFKEGDYDQYHKLINDKMTAFLLDTNKVTLLKVTDLMSNGEFDNASKLLPVIRPDKLDEFSKITYFQLCSQVAKENRDEKLFKDINEQLKKIKSEKYGSFIAALIEENQINLKLYCHFDASVIHQLEKIVKVNTGENKGKIMMSLAKAYYLNHEEEKCLEILKQASKLIDDKNYQQVIKMCENDLSILAN